MCLLSRFLGSVPLCGVFDVPLWAAFLLVLQDASVVHILVMLKYPISLQLSAYMNEFSAMANRMTFIGCGHVCSTSCPFRVDLHSCEHAGASSSSRCALHGIGLQPRRLHSGHASHGGRGMSCTAAPPNIARISMRLRPTDTRLGPNEHFYTIGQKVSTTVAVVGPLP